MVDKKQTQNRSVCSGYGHKLIFSFIWWNFVCISVLTLISDT